MAKKFKTVDAAEVLERAAEIVQEFGDDYIYEPPAGMCQYVHTPQPGLLQPGCLVGQILVRLGAQLETLKTVEDFYMDRGEGVSVEDLLQGLEPTWSTLGFTLTPGAIDVLGEIQNIQDTAEPWGKALEEGRIRAQELSQV